MKINTNNWEPFLIGAMFDIRPTKAYQNLSKDELDDGGSTPFVVNSAENNGVGGYSTLDATEHGGIITFSDTTDGNTFFYQPDDFIGFAHVQGMYPTNRVWSKNELLFLVTILTHVNLGRYNYGRKMTRENISKTHVYLPSTPDKKPDYGFMNAYIENLKCKPITTSIGATPKPVLNIKDWRPFRIDSLFCVKKGKRLTSEDQTEGATPYIGAIDSNNGISNYIGQDATHSGNTISLSYNGSVGEAFYQPIPFWATDDVNVLYFREENKVEFNKYLALFICTVLRQEKYRYCYGRKWTLESMNNTEIMLPSKNGIPDWEWMENYVKSLPYSDRI